MATVNKDFKIKNGLIVEGANATVGGFNVLTKSTDDQNFIIGLIGGSATSENTADSVVLRDANGDFAGGTITAETGFSGDLTGDVTGNVTGNVTGTVSDISNHSTDTLSEGTTNLYHTDARVRGALSGGTGIDFNGTTGEITVDSTIATQTYVDTAEADAVTTANTYTDGRETAITSAYESYADTAEADAISTSNNYTDNLIGDITVDGTAGNTVTDRISTAVSNLVDGAPELLNTLDELAAALGDNPDVITNLTTTIGTKVSKSGDTMTGFLTLSADPTADGHAATKKYVDDQNTSQTAAITAAYEAYADGATTDMATETYVNAQDTATLADANLYTDTEIAALTTDGVAEGTNLYFTDERAQDAVAAAFAAGTQTNITVSYNDSTESFDFVAENGVADSDTDDLTEGSSNLYFTDARAISALEAVVPNFTEVDINSVATQVAATVNVPTAGVANAHQFARADYDSAEYVVKIDDGTHTEVSKVLLTLDSSNNIAITEYGIVGTNGSLGTVSATTDGTNVTLQVTTVNTNSDVTVAGTLIK